jgi:hypothetical protein
MPVGVTADMLRRSPRATDPCSPRLTDVVNRSGRSRGGAATTNDRMELTAAIQGLRGCKWVAIEAAYKEAMEDLLKLQFYLTQDHVDQLSHSRLLSEEVAIEAHLRLLKKRLRIPLLRIYVFAGLRSLSGFSRYQTPKAACTQPPTHWASRKVYWRSLTNLLDFVVSGKFLDYVCDARPRNDQRFGLRKDLYC